MPSDNSGGGRSGAGAGGASIPRAIPPQAVPAPFPPEVGQGAGPRVLRESSPNKAPRGVNGGGGGGGGGGVSAEMAARRNNSPLFDYTVADGDGDYCAGDVSSSGQAGPAALGLLPPEGTPAAAGRGAGGTRMDYNGGGDFGGDEFGMSQVRAIRKNFAGWRQICYDVVFGFL